MNHTEIDLLQYKEYKNLLFRFGLSLLAAYSLYVFIVVRIWMNYAGNRLNYYEATSYMVFYVIMLIWAVYITHRLNLRVPLYCILALFSILIYLDGVNNRIPVIDMVFSFTVDIISLPRNKGELIDALYSMKSFIGDSFYEALLTWVILDVPFQIYESRQVNKWETSVRYVFQSISNQIMFFTSLNDISALHIQKNQAHSLLIESFSKKKIRNYSWKILFCRKSSPYLLQYLQTKEEYEYLLFLLQEIRSNPMDLDGREYLRLLYETEAIFKRSKIINTE